MPPARKNVGSVHSRTLLHRLPLFLAATWTLGVMVPVAVIGQRATEQTAHATPAVQQQKEPTPEEVKALQQKAAQGSAEAQYELGTLCFVGLGGVPQDDAQAFAWFRRAAEQGFAEAQSKLGFLYFNGRGVPLDAAQAVGWSRKAESWAPPGPRVPGASGPGTHSRPRRLVPGLPMKPGYQLQAVPRCHPWSGPPLALFSPVA